MSNEENVVLGATVKAIRAVVGLKQDAFDEACDLSPQTTAHAERGGRKIYDEDIALICRRLKIKRREFNYIKDVLTDVYRRNHK